MRYMAGTGRLCWLLTLALCPTLATAQLSPPSVVKASISGPAQAPAGRPFELVVTLAISPGYHIQAHKAAQGYIPTEVQVAAPAGFKVGAPIFPAPGSTKVAGDTIPVYAGRIAVRVPVTPPNGARGVQKLKATVSYQACNETNCFPPTRASAAGTVTLGAAKRKAEDAPPPGQPAAMAGSRPPVGGAVPGYRESRITQFVKPDEFVKFLTAGSGSQDAGAGVVTRLLHGGNLLLALPLIFLLGLALNLTPCVYPLIPITIGYFGGQAASGRKPVILALFYLLGMALMYSALGVFAGLNDKLFGSQLQNPWVLAGFAAIMFALALSQFDRPSGVPIWEFQLPAALRNKAQARSGVLGALLMGLMVGVVAAPCIGPAVVALLVWVGSTHSAAMGFVVFFTLSIGLGLPYLFLASVSGSIRKLPRSGEWLVGVKHVFGAIMAWMGVYYLQTILNNWKPGLGGWLLVAATALGGIYLLFVDRAGAQARVFFVGKRLIGLGAVGAAVWLALPAPPPPAKTIDWQPYSEAAIELARAERKPVLIDFTATWCAACKELDHYTFRDAKVGAAAAGYVALRADLSDADDNTRFSRKYGIVGLPTVVRLVPADKAIAER